MQKLFLVLREPEVVVFFLDDLYVEIWMNETVSALIELRVRLLKLATHTVLHRIRGFVYVTITFAALPKRLRRALVSRTRRARKRVVGNTESVSK